MDEMASLRLDQPVLIYDNKCSPCWKGAKIARRLSRGRIRLIGHYDSDDFSDEVKTAVFPPGYDPTSMSWLVNKNGAYGGRAWIVPLALEIIKGITMGSKRNAPVQKEDPGNACMMRRSWYRYIMGFLRSSGRFRFSS